MMETTEEKFSLVIGGPFYRVQECVSIVLCIMLAPVSNQ